MSIRVLCPACGRALTARDDLAGNRVKCPACGAPVTVMAVAANPAASSVASEPVQPATPSPVTPETVLAPAPNAARPAAIGLDGLSPDYRIRVRHWLDVALPHYRAVLPTFAGCFALFIPVFGTSLYFAAIPFVLLSEFGRSGIMVAVALLLLPICVIPFLAVVPSYAVGFHMICQAQLKARPWKFEMCFSGFRLIKRMALRGLALAGVELAAVIPALVVSGLTRLIWDNPPAVVVGLSAAFALACSLAGAYVLVRLMFFSHLLIIDRNCGFVEAMRGSWLLSRGHFWGLVGTLVLGLGAACLAPILVVGIDLVLPIPFFLLLCLMLLAIVATFLVLPVAVLWLNAGYLLIAGADLLPGHARDSERTAIPIVPQWNPIAIGSVATVVLLFGVGMGWLAHAAQARLEKELALRNKKAAEYAERSRIEESRAREEAVRLAQPLVAFFRQGGTWSLELFEADELPLEARAMSTGGPGQPGFAPAGSNGPTMAAEAIGTNQRILVLGPRDLRETQPTVRLGSAVWPGAEPHGAAQQVENLPIAGQALRDEFFRQFAEALGNGEVQVVLVEVSLRDETGAGGAARVGGAGFRGGPAGGAGGLGSAAAGAAPGGGTPGNGFDEPGRGGPAGWAELGTPVSIENAVPLTRERFLKIVESLKSW